MIEKENEDEITRLICSGLCLVVFGWVLAGRWLDCCGASPSSASPSGCSASSWQDWHFSRLAKVIVYGGGAPSLLMNLLWLLFGGFALAISAALHGLLFCITIVGIPLWDAVL